MPAVSRVRRRMSFDTRASSSYPSLQEGVEVNRDTGAPQGSDAGGTWAEG
jgi:hypothetical protein